MHALLANDRSDATRTATLRPSLIATDAAVATPAALAFLPLRSAAGDAAAAKGPVVVSTPSSGRGRIPVDSRALPYAAVWKW